VFIEKYNGTGGCLAVIRVRVTYFDCDFCCPAVSQSLDCFFRGKFIAVQSEKWRQIAENLRRAS